MRTGQSRFFMEPNAIWVEIENEERMKEKREEGDRPSRCDSVHMRQNIVQARGE